MATGQRITFLGWTGDEGDDETQAAILGTVLPRPDYMLRGWHAVRLDTGRELWASERELI